MITQERCAILFGPVTHSSGSHWRSPLANSFFPIYAVYILLDQLYPLHAAARDNNHQLLRSLLTAGAKVDQMTKASETPLYWAAKKNAVDCVTVLLAHGADPTVAIEDGETPLQRALRKGHSAVVALLEAAIGKKHPSPFFFFLQKKRGERGLSEQKKGDNDYPRTVRHLFWTSNSQ